ncbi:DNA primase [Ornithobacterium rhinotracheale]|uniref:DNA primase n=1 Tax=Ornithobacterium rhinotracheale TaxID=28251 RepID=UPI00129C3F59|nr:DNA primase [Ornithobacterium rhinotracheale]MRI63131.1 DNA primase [Ornithobacterium rhinotracheale]
MITQSTIDEIFSTARVEEVIGDFIQLKKSGSNFKGFSPFSNEKTPSFMVSPAKQIWKDFSSGKGGSVVSFLMEHEQFTYPEALRWLAKRYNITIEEDQEQSEEQLAQVKEKENQFTLTAFAAKFFKEQLHNTEEGKIIGLSYFRERGFNDKTIETFDLGYSPKAWEAFTQYAKDSGYSVDLLKNTGLTVGSGDRAVDRFRERVMFPIHSFSGRILGFGGRILNNQAKAAKYLNSPENEIYHKSKILYGIYQAKQSILKKDECILVEGYTDVLSLHQAGIENVVASSGTALTPEQIRLIKRLTHNLILIYDGDAAGIKASFRGIDLILAQELNAKIVVLPDGDDPDSFAKKHSDTEIQEFISKNAVDFIKFKIKILSEEAGNDPSKRAEMVGSVVHSIALIPNLIQRELYVREAAHLLDLREETLFRQLGVELQKIAKESRGATPQNSVESAPIKIAKPEAPSFGIQDKTAQIEAQILEVIALSEDKKFIFKSLLPEEKDQFYESTVLEEVLANLEEDEIEFSTPFYRERLAEIKNQWEQRGLIDISEFMRQADERIVMMYTNFLTEKYFLSDWKKHGTHVPTLEENTPLHTQHLMLSYKVLKIKKEAQLAKEELKKELSPDERNAVLRNLMHLKQILTKAEILLDKSV